MDSNYAACKVLLLSLIIFCTSNQCCASGIIANQTAWFLVNVSESPVRKIPQTMFGISFEEINHSGAGGLWAELVSNRGFEAGGQNTPSNISPWSVLGDESSIVVSTDRSSCFDRNKVALQMEVLCNTDGDNICPAGGVGVYNPGFWGMNIEQGKTYKVTLYVRSLQPIEMSVSFIGSNGLQTLATGHGFRHDLFNMLADLKPGFIRFPGGSFVEGDWLVNAFRWKETIGKWKRDLAIWRCALPVWVFNNGISRNDQVDTLSFYLLCKYDILDALEFARGDPTSTWGSVRAAMGHEEPLICDMLLLGIRTVETRIIMFYTAIKGAYPDIKIISNCDGSVRQLDHPADLYDYHVYTNANSMFSMAHNFDHTSRSGPKAFVSEYAVTGNDAGRGSLLKALAEAGFLLGLERNSDVVEMASNAPLFVNDNDRRFNPDAIVFDSSKVYGTPSYWMQHFFKESNGAILLNSKLQTSSSTPLIASAISWKNPEDNKSYLRIKVVNFGSNRVSLNVSADGLDQNSIEAAGSTTTTLTSNNVMDENSFIEPKRVAPIISPLENASNKMNVIVPPYSLTSIDLLRKSTVIQVAGSKAVHTSL
ncbi:hypothetical protein Pfo_029129 [Paulownia fortunei]|nr:hypothetical protein Pfo_029129 [Paulownia fortunei]